MKFHRALAVLASGLVLPVNVWSADPETLPAKTGLVDPLIEHEMTAPAGKVIAKALKDPYLHKELLDALLTKVWEFDHTNAILGLLNDLNLQPKVFHATGGGGDEAVLGFEYAYDKSLAGRVINATKRDPFGLSLNFHANGNVAANAGKNPDSFLETGLRFSLFQSIGGVEPMVYSDAAAEESAKAAFNSTFIETTGAESEKDPRWIAATKGWGKHVIPQFLWTVAGNASLEADQQFHNKQWAYGGQLGLSARDWRDEHWISWLNLPDYPFALIRALTEQGTPEFHFQPSGHSFPTFLGGVDLVDPTDNTARLAFDPDNEAYPRLRVEVSFKTPVGMLLSKEVWFSSSYRIYHEIDASTAIQAADLETFQYFVAKLDFLGGFNVSYSAGKLPLDRKVDHVFALGYSINF